MTFSARTLLRTALIALAALLIALYTAYQLRNLIRGPILDIASPQSGETMEDPLIELTGSAHNISYISINDRPMFVDPEGNFSDLLLLPYGYTILTVKAGDRFGRTVERSIEVMYQ